MSVMREELVAEINRLTAVVQAMDAAMGTDSETIIASSDGTPLKIYKKRRQTPESKARISAYQKKKWETIRAVQSGAVTLESLSPDQQDMIKHVTGISPHPAVQPTPLAKPAQPKGNTPPVSKTTRHRR
jgi:hypothetical protein